MAWIVAVGIPEESYSEAWIVAVGISSDHGSRGYGVYTIVCTHRRGAISNIIHNTFIMVTSVCVCVRVRVRVCACTYNIIIIGRCGWITVCFRL